MKPHENPNGISPQSPGPRGTSYPGCMTEDVPSTLKGLWQAELKENHWATTLTGFSTVGHRPRVARSSQPWALRQNPFGIFCRSRTLEFISMAASRYITKTVAGLVIIVWLGASLA